MTASAVLQTSIRRVVRAGGKADTHRREEATRRREEPPQATSEVHPVYLLYWYTSTNTDAAETLRPCPPCLIRAVVSQEMDKARG
jgi:hypothetical protein